MKMTCRFVSRSEAVLLCAAIAMGAGCGGGGGGGGGPPSASATVDATGGTVTLAGGPSLTIPAGALAASTTITITDTGQAARPGGEIYEFTPAGTSFAHPVTVQMPVPAGVASPRIYWTQAGSTTQFDALATTVASGVATAQVSHFSLAYVAAGPPAATPTFTPAGGTYTAAQSVTIASTTPGAAIHYTTDGSDPTAASTTYTAPVSVATTTTLKAIATATGYTASAIGTATYTIGGGGGNVMVDFSSCGAGSLAVWLAYQDGRSGAWTPVTGVGNVYGFSIASTVAGVAWVVLPSATQSEVNVLYASQAQLTSGPVVVCPPSATKTVNGTAAGLLTGDFAYISLGGGTAFVTTSPFQITRVADGAQDLVAFRRSFAGTTPDRAIIRRNLTVANNGSLEPIDFGSAEAFAPDSATITVSGLGAGETLMTSMNYQVAMCETAPLYLGAQAPAGSTSFTAAGIPAAWQLATDFHGLSVQARSGTTTLAALRNVTEYFHALANRTVALPPAMPTPTITSLAGPYLRLQAVYTLPAEYLGATGTSFHYQTPSTVSPVRSVMLSASPAYLGGAATTLALPDFSGVAGWNNSWAAASGTSVEWTVSGASGTALSTSVCTENARVSFATTSGTF
jgi:hypothetical protein